MGTTMDILPAPPDGRTTTHMRARPFCSQERCFSAPGSSPGPLYPEHLSSSTCWPVLQGEKKPV